MVHAELSNCHDDDRTAFTAGSHEHAPWPLARELKRHLWNKGQLRGLASCLRCSLARSPVSSLLPTAGCLREQMPAGRAQPEDSGATSKARPGQRSRSQHWGLNSVMCCRQRFQRMQTRSDLLKPRVPAICKRQYSEECTTSHSFLMSHWRKRWSKLGSCSQTALRHQRAGCGISVSRVSDRMGH